MNKTTLRLLLFGTVSLTALAAIGIKLFVRGDSEEAQPRQAAPAIFQEKPPSAPAMRTVSEVPGGGDSLDMFSKTNKGYYGEDEEEKQAPAASTAPAKAAAPAPARAKPAAKPETARQVIPRIQGVKSFGAPASRAGSIAPTRPGGSIPDMNSIIQSATKDAAQKAGVKKTATGD